MSDKVSPLEIPGRLILKNYATDFVIYGGILLVLSLFWGDLLLMNVGQLWRFEAIGLTHVWWLFAWAVVGAFINEAKWSYDSKPMLLARATWLSLNAGFWEELKYRWLLFFTAMITIPFANFITFGLVWQVNYHILIPLANWATFGALAPQLYAENWVLAAAIISAAGAFRDAHKYQGWQGVIQTWFLGMVFFWLTFNYGIVTAMVAHAAYDLILLVAEALKSERPLFFHRRLRQ